MTRSASSSLRGRFSGLAVAVQGNHQWPMIDEPETWSSIVPTNKLQNLGALRVFSRVAENRSFAGAGSQLNLSASAVGKAIARLEQKFGVRLFHRSTRSVTLTDEGQRLLESCQRVFSEIEAIELDFAKNSTIVRGRLRVSLPLAGMLMMPTLSAFMQAYPQVELDLHFSDHLVDVVNDGYDVVVRTGEASDSRLRARSLGNYRLEVIASPDYLAQAGVPGSPEDLRHHRCLRHRYPSTGKLQRWPFAMRAGVHDLVLPTASVSTSVESLVTLAEAGHGIACVPDFAYRKQLAEGTLVRVLDDFIEHTGTFRAVWPDSPFASPKLRAFVDFLAANLLQTPPDASSDRPRRAAVVPQAMHRASGPRPA